MKSKPVVTAKFPGMNNMDAEGLLRVIHNMTVTPDGKLEKRRGYSLWQSLPGAHSLYFDGVEFLCAARGSGGGARTVVDSLYRVTFGHDVEELCELGGVGDPLYYVKGPKGQIYLSSRSFTGVYERGVWGSGVRDWGTRYSDDPARLADSVNSEEQMLLNTSGPPPMEHLALVGGRIYGSVGSRVYYNDPPMALELYRPDTFFEFGEEIVMIAVSSDGKKLGDNGGVYFASENTTWFAGGMNPEEWQFNIVGDGAVKGSLQYLPAYKYFNDVPIWLNRRGVVAGVNGTIQRLTENKVTLRAGGQAASFYRKQNGGQYVSSFPLPPDVGFSDSATCEVFRRGKLLVEEVASHGEGLAVTDVAECEVVTPTP